MALLEQTFLMLLQIVSLNIDELGRYFIYSLPSLQTCQSEKLWAFTICNCSKENGRQHYIVKKCDASEKTVLTVLCVVSHSVYYNGKPVQCFFFAPARLQTELLCMASFTDTPLLHTDTYRYMLQCLMSLSTHYRSIVLK